MKNRPLSAPRGNPVPLFELYRMAFASDLLVALQTWFRIFDILSCGPLPLNRVTRTLGLPPRSAVVFYSALRALKLITIDSRNLVHATPMAREFLSASNDFFAGDYFGLRGDNSGVKEMVQCLKTGKSLTDESGGEAYVVGGRGRKRKAPPSPMDDPIKGPFLTKALAGRARIVARPFSDVLPRDIGNLLDIAAGSGLYSIGALRAIPHLRVSIFERAPVIKVAQDFADEHGVRDRINFVVGDMFTDPLPECDSILLSNVLHDWDKKRIVKLLKRCYQRLPSGGRLFIHDVFLRDDHSGPLAIALYSLHLFMLTPGRAYSRAEIVSMLEEAGFQVPRPAGRQPRLKKTAVHCAVLTAIKP